MRERARRIGGTLSIETRVPGGGTRVPGGGTRVIVSVPVARDEDAPGSPRLLGRSASVPRLGVAS
jgi:hypothetical protein